MSVSPTWRNSLIYNKDCTQVHNKNKNYETHKQSFFATCHDDDDNTTGHWADLYWCRAESKDLVPGSLGVAVHVDEDVNAILVNHVGGLPIARHLHHTDTHYHSRHRPHPPSPVIVIMQPISWSHSTDPRRVEGWVSLGTEVKPKSLQSVQRHRRITTAAYMH